MEVSNQSTQFSHAKNAWVSTLYNATADETWPEAELQRGLSPKLPWSAIASTTSNWRDPRSGMFERSMAIHTQTANKVDIKLSLIRDGHC
jgi:hypothetical protein